MMAALILLALVFAMGWIAGGLTVPLLVYYWDTR